MHGEHAGATANSSRTAARAKASGAERTVVRGRAAAPFMETITGEQDWMGVVLLDELLGNSGAQGRCRTACAAQERPGRALRMEEAAVLIRGTRWRRSAA